MNSQHGEGLRSWRFNARWTLVVFKFVVREAMIGCQLMNLLKPCSGESLRCGGLGRHESSTYCGPKPG